jgi:hypothetical protein
MFGEPSPLEQAFIWFVCFIIIPLGFMKFFQLIYFIVTHLQWVP